MKITLDLPTDLVREIKLRGVQEGRKLKEVVADLLRFGLKQGALLPQARVPQMGKIALPFFSSPPACARFSNEHRRTHRS